MKQITKLMTRLRGRRQRRQDKSGSTMALVMIITSALVIWAICLAPLMSSTGIAALKVQNSYTDYLGSRSSIEYAKSELIKIVNVDGKAPYTFAVIANNDGTYTAVPKRDDAGSVTELYKNYITYDLIDPYNDQVDAPKSGSAGNDVAAICYVSHVGMSYEIVITSYINGVKSLTIRVPYSHQEKLLIYPEAYRQTEALPLSDYVLVDGKMGGRWVWNSAEKLSGENKAYEHLLPWITLDEQNRLTSYASSGKYPAVFKNTAAASTGLAGGTVVEKPDTTPKNWVMPFASASKSNTAGAIWYDTSNGKVYLGTGSGTTEVTGNCTIYYNGDPSTTKPSAVGIYTVTVDYKGTGTYVEPTDSNANPLNVMPRYGMVLGELSVGSFATQSQTAPEELTVSEGSYSSNKLKVTLKAQRWVDGGRFNDDYLESYTSGTYVFGYCTDTDSTVNWFATTTNSKAEASIDLPLGNTYYFYCYKPGYISNGTVYNPSDVVKGNKDVYLYTAATTPSGNGKYYVMNGDGFAMNNNLSTSDFGTINQTDKVLYGSSSNWSKSAYQWTLSGSGNSWSFKNSDGKYLTLEQTATGEQNKTPNSAGKTLYPYSYAEKLSSSAQNLDVTSSGVSYTFNRDKYVSKSESTGSGCNKVEKYWWEKEKTAEPYTHYLTIGNSKVEDATKASTFYFVAIPGTVLPAPSTSAVKNQIVNPFYTISGFPVDYGTNVVNAVNTELGKIQNGLTATALTANTNTTVTGTLNPGTYMLQGTTSDGKQLVPFQVTVRQNQLTSEALTVSAEKNGSADHEMKVTGSGWHNKDVGGIRYFGYKVEGEANYHWDFVDSSAAQNSSVFLVDYNTKYILTIKESGTWEHIAGPESATAEYTVIPKPVDADTWAPTDFVYSFDEDGKVRWHAIPDNITVDLITLVYRYEDITTGTVTPWTEDATSNYNTYGVMVAGSQYGTLETAFEIGPPLAVTNNNGHCTSMVKGQSIYMMGEGNSLNTYGNSVYLYTDLLVLKNNITGGGQVWLDSYSNNKTGVLLFAVNNINMANGQAVFKAHHFYLLPVVNDNRHTGIDLYSITPEEAQSYDVGYIDYELLAGGTDTLANVRPLYQNKGYPAPNMDIAFANPTQLGAIKNSETLGWTVDGVLKTGGTNDSDGAYAVCAYISDISSASSNISYSANRVMIAAKDSDVNEVLKVPNAVTFTCRYLSVDAHTIAQESSVGALTLKNLANSNNWLRDALGVSYTQSRTLQIDYEQATTLDYFSSGTPDRLIPRQVYRYEDGTNIFGSSTLEKEIMVSYSTSELYDWFTDSKYISRAMATTFGSTAAIVDRYITIDGDNLNIPQSIFASLDIFNTGWFDSKLYVYSNYVHFGKISRIDLSQGSIIINCQENGYKESQDYLGNFTSTADSYSGTLLYFAGDISFSYKDSIYSSTKTVVIPEGFYYIFAKDGGTNLLELATNLYTGTDLSKNTSKKPFKVDPDTLDDYSVYIRRDGGISSAYVETVLDYTGSLGSFFGKAEVE